MSVIRAAVTRVLVLAALILAGTAEVSLADQTGPDTATSPSQDQLTGGSLVELWMLRNDHLQRGNTLAADELVGELRLQRRVNGVARSEDVAGAFVLEGYEQLELTQFHEARTAFQLAIEFDSEMPGAWIGLARTEWESGAGVGAAAGAYRSGALALLANWHNRTLLLVSWMWSALLGIILASALLLVLLFFKTFRIVHHDMTEILSHWLPSTTASTVAAIVPSITNAIFVIIELYRVPDICAVIETIRYSISVHMHIEPFINHTITVIINSVADFRSSWMDVFIRIITIHFCRCTARTLRI